LPFSEFVVPSFNTIKGFKVSFTVEQITYTVQATGVYKHFIPTQHSNYTGCAYVYIYICVCCKQQMVVMSEHDVNNVKMHNIP